ncbi:MAG: putative toxin-antitoxin system toxin component, PIN family [Aeropyrum sp.]|nr:putative toxin-antitoxin system toxin component, PIN family [Aeropyrum sp.]
MARGGGEEEAEERSTRKRAVVLDTNIIISSLLKPDGFTRRVLLLLEDQADLYAPEVLLDELGRKIELLALDKGLSADELRYLLALLLSSVRTVESRVIRSFMSIALEYARDPDDAPFVALALHLRTVYEDVIILTWNISDYKGSDLERLKIRVLTPRDIETAIGETL